MSQPRHHIRVLVLSSWPLLDHKIVILQEEAPSEELARVVLDRLDVLEGLVVREDGELRSVQIRAEFLYGPADG